MPNDLLIAVLAYGHVLSAMGWLGGGILLTFVLGPNLRNLAPPAALEFNVKILPKLLRSVQVSVILTLLFGVGLVYFFNDGDLSWLSNSTQGLIISTGAFIAFVVAALAFSVIIPSFRRVIALSKTAMETHQPPPPEMMKFGKRARLGSVLAILMLLFVLAMMITSGFLY